MFKLDLECTPKQQYPVNPVRGLAVCSQMMTSANNVKVKRFWRLKRILKWHSKRGLLMAIR
jgi:hypothetical protein